MKFIASVENEFLRKLSRFLEVIMILKIRLLFHMEMVSNMDLLSCND